MTVARWNSAAFAGRISRKASGLVALLGVILFSAACEQTPAAPAAPAATGGFTDAIGHYARARLLDLVDIVSLRVGAGPGLLVQARVTQYAAIGLGSIGPAHVFSGGFRPECYFLGWNGREGGLWIERRTEYGISTFYGCESSGEAQAGNVRHFGLDARRTFDIGAEAFIALVGVAVDVRVIEALDFVAGTVGFDPMGDDGAPLSEAPVVPGSP